MIRILLFLFGFALSAISSGAEIRNVLLIVSDDLKASVLGCYGDRFCETPNIDRLAAEGMVFERAYCQGTVCGPSRTSFMHSRYRGEVELNLGKHLIDNGFYSARVGKIYHMRVPGDIIAGTDGNDVATTWVEHFNSKGLEAHTPGNYACLNLNIFTTELEGRESTQMKNRMFVSVDYEGDGSDQPDFKSAGKAVELLREHREGPFFIATGFVRPHYPSVAPVHYFEAYPIEQMELPETMEGDLADIPKAGIAGTTSENCGIAKWPENQQRMWAAYYATVTFMDEQVGRLLDELDALGLRESTAVVFASDHGYHLGEHTFWQKSNLHEEVTRVPLIISAPGYEPGRSASIVELVDIYPTVCELTGVEIPEPVQGKSLVPVLKDPGATVKTGALSFAGGISLRTPRWAYMQYAEEEELYDMNADPEQFTNLAGKKDYTGKLEEMRAAFEKRLQEAGVDAPGAKGKGKGKK